MKNFGGETSLNSFSKANKTSEKTGFFSYEWFDCPGKNQSTEFPSHDAFYSKLRSSNPLEAEHTEYVNLLNSRLTAEQTDIKLKLSKPPPTGFENYQDVQQMWMQDQMRSLKDFLRWYNNKNVVPALEVMKK